MLLTDRHRSLFGASVAAPLLPLELAGTHSVISRWSNEFLALRMTFALHAMAGLLIGFAVAFKTVRLPYGQREWLLAGLLAIIPVGWVGSAIMAQDDSIAAFWSGICLLAVIYLGAIPAVIAAGLGILFGKTFLAIAMLGIWIGSPGRRWQVAAWSGSLILAFFAFLLWRDGELLYRAYSVDPIMGATPYGIATLLGWPPSIRDIKVESAMLILTSMTAFGYFAVRQRLSTVAATCGLFSLFLTFYFGTVPEYEMWYLPLIIVTLWVSIVQRRWGLFAAGWLHSFFGYGYKVAYGFNDRFAASGKPALKEWYYLHIGLDVQWLQILLGVATIACSLTFAILLLRKSPSDGSIDRLRLP